MLQSREGGPVPKSQFRVRDGAGWKTVDSADVFAGKVVVAFGLPGAFTPTCSSSHVPRFNELAPAFKSLGVDDIVCISVNDPYVMEAWRFAQGADQLTFLPDGNGSFSEALGMLVDKTKTGMGKRSRRYSMLVRDAVVERMFIEPEAGGDSVATADADTMLEYLGGVAPPDIVLFTRFGCVHCARARRMLAEHGLPWVEAATSPRILRALPGNRTTPQAFIDGLHIGGADELAKWISLLPHAGNGAPRPRVAATARNVDANADTSPGRSVV
jgi:peroxiredoxin/glutaredoxin